MKMWSGAAFGSRKAKLCAVAWVVLLFSGVQVMAQDGSAGIEQANTLVRQYFDTGINLMYGIGAVLGLIGAVRVYQRWSAGDPHTGQIAASWFGSCIFLVIVATVLRSFFGL